MIWINVFLSVLVVSLISLAGIFFLVLKKESLNKLQLILVGFATGGLLGGAFFHLLPETFGIYKKPAYASIWIIVGFLLFFILERFLHWHHSHNLSSNNNAIKPFGIVNLLADMLHNFLDGILIAASYKYSFEIGLVTTITVLMHELPQEIGDFGVLIHAGFSRKKALIYNYLSACSAFIGAFIILLLNQPASELSKIILPFAAGGFIYLAAADLVPELHTEKKILRSVYQFIALLAGMSLLLIMSLVD